MCETPVAYHLISSSHFQPFPCIFIGSEYFSVMARLSFALVTIFCLALLASTSEAKKKRHARVRILNSSGKLIEADSITVDHKYSNNYRNQLYFNKSLSHGQYDDAGGENLAEYNTGLGTTGVDWWQISWVFTADQEISITDPNNFQCFLNELEKYGKTIISKASAVIAGVASCGFPPVVGCAASPFVAKGAAVAARAMAGLVLNDARTCGFKMFTLRKEDDRIKNKGAWVTIEILPNWGLRFSSPSGSAKTVYTVTAIKPDGSVVIDKTQLDAHRSEAALAEFGTKMVTEDHEELLEDPEDPHEEFDPLQSVLS